MIKYVKCNNTANFIGIIVYKIIMFFNVCSVNYIAVKIAFKLKKHCANTKYN